MDNRARARHHASRVETWCTSKHSCPYSPKVAMTHADLLVGVEKPKSLAEFASRFFEAAHVARFELRDSENYVDGHYFIARTGPRTFRVMLSSDRDHCDLPYWVQMISTDDAEPLTMAEIDALASILFQQGYKVARIVNFGRIDETRFDYPFKR